MIEVSGSGYRCTKLFEIQMAGLKINLSDMNFQEGTGRVGFW